MAILSFVLVEIFCKTGWFYNGWSYIIVAISIKFYHNKIFNE